MRENEILKSKLMIVDDVIVSQSDEGGESCVVRGKSVAGAGGYTRIKHGESMVALCCPLCLATFQKNPQDWVHQAVNGAKEYITVAIATSQRVGRHSVLKNFQNS